MDDKIRDLHVAGWSERRIAAALGVTRHRVRASLRELRPSIPLHTGTWAEEVGLHLGRGKLRKGDEEQVELGVLALDVAEWLDTHDNDGWNARQLAISVRHVVEGVVKGPTPLVRIHARLVGRMLTHGEEPGVADECQ